jgi:hypothetical protein
MQRSRMHLSAAPKKQPLGGSWSLVSIKMISHYIEMETRVESNDNGSSDPRLGSLLVLSALSLPMSHHLAHESSRDESTNGNRGGSGRGRGGSDSWTESTPDLRPGDLLMIKSAHLGSRVALGIVLIWNPDSVLCASSSQYGEGQSEEGGQLIKIVVCVCKPDSSPTTSSTSSSAETGKTNPNDTKGNKRSRDSESQDAINYMNIYGGWLQEGDICQGSLLEIMVIRYSLSLSLSLSLLLTSSQQHCHSKQRMSSSLHIIIIPSKTETNHSLSNS